jgi:hypothetical protein
VWVGLELAFGEALQSLIEQPAQQWADVALDKLEQGHADAVAYATYRANGWSTASSEAESGHRHVVQQRVKVPGAWWRPDQVDHILALWMLEANGLWDAYWNTRRTRWRQDAALLEA